MKSPYPRLKQGRQNYPWRRVDQVVAGVMAMWMIAIAAVSDPLTSGFVPLLLMIWPSVFLWFLNRWTGILFILCALPNLLLAYIGCDTESGLVTKLLHPYHDYGWIFMLYGFVRACKVWCKPEDGYFERA